MAIASYKNRASKHLAYLLAMRNLAMMNYAKFFEKCICSTTQYYSYLSCQSATGCLRAQLAFPGGEVVHHGNQLLCSVAACYSLFSSQLSAHRNWHQQGVLEQSVLLLKASQLESWDSMDGSIITYYWSNLAMAQLWDSVKFEWPVSYR